MYFLPLSVMLLSASFLVTTSKPLRNHFVATPLPSSTFPVPCHLSSALAMVRRVNILLLPRLVVEYSVLSLSISPESYSGIVCLPATCQVLGVNSPSIPASTSYTFHFSPQKFAHLQILLYLCSRKLGAKNNIEQY